MIVRGVGVVGLSLGLLGCGESTPPPRRTLDIQTASFDVPAGEERYLCWTETLTEDIVVDRFDYAARPVIHHLLVSRSLIPVEDGLAECDVLFRPTWAPLFIAGSGDAALEAPPGAGYHLPAGTQLVTQLHLLNTTSATVSDAATVTMREHEPGEDERIGIFSFGTTDIDIPANATSQVENDCTVDKGVEIFAWLPHMHYLGTSITLEVGMSSDSMQEAYRLDPWDFDDQIVDPVPVSLAAGMHTRTTCSYDNPTDTPVGFGESSFDEMCFLVGFATGVTQDLDGCLNLISEDQPLPVPPDPAAGTCGEHEVNEQGIGQACTNGGGECPSGLSCTADQQDEPEGFCLKIGGCETTPDCGGGWATCCAPAEAGGLINICLPEACRPADCIPVE